MSLDKLKKFTQARIDLARSGWALKTCELLKLKEDLAKAQDAVLSPWCWESLQQKLEEQNYKTLALKSRADSREIYLQRPDLGRILSEESENILSHIKPNYDIVIIISDGLSSRAITNNFLGLWNILSLLLNKSKFSLAPLCLVPFARVALSDQIAFRIKAKLSIIILGERPGLSAPDSLGIYLTYKPHESTCDADRNCISNIRAPDGLSYEDAAHKLWYLITTSFKLKLSGVNLKESFSHPKHISTRRLPK